MSDLAGYRNKKIPLALRMRRAAQDNLESSELDTLVDDWATELRAIGDILREYANDAEEALDNNCFDSEDLDGAFDGLTSGMRYLIGEDTST